MKNIKEITDIFEQEIKKKYTPQITMPIYMGVSDMEIILEEIERLNNIIKNTAVELEILLQSEDFELLTMQLRNIVFRLKGSDLVSILSEIPTKEFVENYYEPKTKREWEVIDFIDRYLALDLDEFNSKSLLNKIKEILSREK